jgi:hypothetical protein
MWSSGPGRWEYIRLPEGEPAKSFFGEMGREWDHSEHFRGIEYHRCKKPPAKWLKDEIDSLTRRSINARQQASAYRSLLETYEKV